MNSNAASDISRKLPIVRDAIFHSSKPETEPICMEGTRQEVLSEIYHWADGEHEQSVLWLSGWAKVGKSTIARTVAKEYYERERLGGSFFFAEGNEKRDSLESFVGTMAHQLAEFNESYRNSLRSILHQNSILTDCPLTKQWDRLIWEPLVKIYKSQDMLPTVLVIDALDECKEDITSILEIFCKTRSRYLRLLITSRSATYDQFCYQIKEECQSIILHDVQQESVNNDLLYLFRKSLPDFIFDSFDEELLLGKLVERAGGLYVVATALTRYLKCESLVVRDRVLAILTGKSKREPPESILDSVYCNALEKSIPDDLHENDRQDHCDSIKHALGGIAIMFTEISVNSFYNLFYLRKGVSTFDREVIHRSLRRLSAILIVPQKASDKKQSFRLHHSALCDFLFDTSRCNMYSIDKKEAHLRVLECCIQVLDERLSQYLECLKMPERSLETTNWRLDERFSVDEIQYACIYWVKHLEGSNFQLCDNDIIHKFLRKHVLDWLEALCRITMVDDVLEAVCLLGKSKRVGLLVHRSD